VNEILEKILPNFSVENIFYHSCEKTNNKIDLENFNLNPPPEINDFHKKRKTESSVFVTKNGIFLKNGNDSFFKIW